MKESTLQCHVADYLRLQYPHVLFHSDFGAGLKLTPGQAAKQKRQNGGRRAWPDLFIAEPRYQEIEAWADIEGYEGLYKVSDHGRVKRVDGGTERLIKIQVNQHNGYCYAHLSKDGKVKAHRVHRLVAEHFIENPENKEQVNHRDGDKTNNMYTNLEWLSASENQLHRYRVLGKDGGGRPARRVKCIETGRLYKSIADAMRDTGVEHIKEVINGDRKTAGGYRWQEL